MLKPVFKILVVTTMLLAFVGQALAYSTMSCDMADESHHQMMSHSSMNAAMMNNVDNHHRMMENSNITVMEDCCDIECKCPANACISITLVSSDHRYTKISTTIDKISSLDLMTPQSQTKSLYRPPIVA